MRYSFLLQRRKRYEFADLYWGDGRGDLSDSDVALYLVPQGDTLALYQKFIVLLALCGVSRYDRSCHFLFHREYDHRGGGYGGGGGVGILQASLNCGFPVCRRLCLGNVIFLIKQNGWFGKNQP